MYTSVGKLQKTKRIMNEFYKLVKLSFADVDC